MKDISTFQRAQGKWADATFPGQPITAKIKHLAKEVEELLAEPQSLSEQADCFSLLLGIARVSGHPAETLLRAAFEKLEINKCRQWNPPDADGVCLHKKET